MNRARTLAFIAFLSMITATFFIWYQIISITSYTTPKFYFLDVGQGDSELVILPGGVKVLTDAGPDTKVVQSLESVLPASDRYIDLAVITHPQADHFGGFINILERYRIGAFIINGRADDPQVKSWPALIDAIKARHIPLITLKAGDSLAYGKSTIFFLGPDDRNVQSGELNDTVLVELVDVPPIRALLTADIDANREHELVQRFDIHADILKVCHHGSRYSSSDEFLKAVDPKVAVIEVGAKNSYGHPGKETLQRLASSTQAQVYRTDRQGNIGIIFVQNALKVFTQKQ